MKAEKIPFEQWKADVALTIGKLLIKLCEDVSKDTNRNKPYLTIEEIKQFYDYMYNMYYNDKVELLQVQEPTK